MINDMPLISICIPAYKRVHSLKRLLDSIEKQSFKNFEVVITDDSPDDSVREIVETYKEKFPLHYYKNSSALGTPANWNSSIDKASGEWIKIMHDDDWFANEQSLERFAHHTDGAKKFIFSDYLSMDEEKKTQIKSAISGSWIKRIAADPFSLYATNKIGPPSVTLIHKSVMEKFDETLKWLVDIEFYIHILSKKNQFISINEPLIYIGLNEAQVTNACFLNPSVELPEGIYLIEKYGFNKLKNIWVYDAWWRLFRNMRIKSEAELELYAPRKWPQALVSMLNDQQKYSSRLLRNGFFSKAMMFLSYKKNTAILN